MFREGAAQAESVRPPAPPHLQLCRKTESSSKHCLGLSEVLLHLEGIDSFLRNVPFCRCLCARDVSPQVSEIDKEALYMLAE